MADGSAEGAAGRRPEYITVAVTVVAGGTFHDRVLRFHEGATVAHLRAALAEDGLDTGLQLIVDGAARSDTERLADLDLRHGATIGATRSTTTVTDSDEVAAVGGLWAGASVPLHRDPVLVGRGTQADLRLDDPDLSRVHLRVEHRNGRAYVADEHSTNGTYMAGKKINGIELNPSDVVEAGMSLFAVRRAPTREVQLAPVGVFRRFNRPPRTHPTPSWQVLDRPREPARRQIRAFPLLMMVVPIVLGITLFIVYPGRNKIFLLFIAMSPLMMLANVITDRRSGRKSDRAARRAYAAELATFEAKLADALAAERVLRRERPPDPACVLAAAVGPTSLLWERRAADDDALVIRLGLGRLPAETTVRGEDPPELDAVPVLVDLKADSVVGLAGKRPALLAAARAVVCHLTALHAPNELGIVVLAADTGPDWSWVGWLPHVRAHLDEVDGPLRLAVRSEAVRGEVGRLKAEIDSRRQSRAAHRALVVVLDGAVALRTVAGMSRLLADGPGQQVYFVALDGRRADLPAECRATLELLDGEDEGKARLRLTGRPQVELYPDGVSASHAHRLARALAPVVLATDRPDSQLPSAVGFLAAHATGELSADDVRGRWAANTERRPMALLGVQATGPLRIDLRNGYDGPHVLVGGRTGMGKSDLLGSLVCSLALNLPPSALRFLLFDLKEGSGLAPFAALPHTLGLITNLEAANVERVLTSLAAMRAERQRRLRERGTPNYDDYVADGAGRGQRIDMPRLVVVVDEFAELRDKYADALERLVEIARLGRSAGIHLVLGTQLVGRQVTDEIKGNSNLRICLTVDDPAESRQVVDVPDAAVWADRLPGRAVARSDRVRATFQAGWLGARAAVGYGPTRPCLIEPFGTEPTRTEPTGRSAVDTTAASATGGSSGSPACAGGTDLRRVLAAVAGAAELDGETDLGLALHPSLPSTLALTDILRSTVGHQVDGTRVPAAGQLTRAGLAPGSVVLGRKDLPGELAQPPYLHDFDTDGHLLVQGASRSGRSTVLRTLTASSALLRRCDEAHVYVADSGGGALTDLAAFPHVGAVVDTADTDRTERLFALLDAEIRRRQKQVAGFDSGVGAQPKPPRVVLLVDRFGSFWDRYNEWDDGRLVDAFRQLLRDGPAVGVWCVVTDDGVGLAARSTHGIRSRLLLPLPDSADYVSAGLTPGRAATGLPPGRGYTLPDEAEVQIAVAPETLAAAVSARDGDVPTERRPRRLEPLPTNIAAIEVEAHRRDSPPTGPAVVTLGLGGAELSPVDIDLDTDGPFLVVSGPPASGRSTTLFTAAASLLSRGKWTPIVVAPRRSPLREHVEGGISGVPVTLLTSADDVAAQLTDLAGQAATRVLLVLDDAERLFEAPAVTALNTVIRDAYDTGLVALAASRPEGWTKGFRNWGEEMRSGQTGVLLNPRLATDGQPVNLISLPRTRLGWTQPGRGLLVVRGRTTVIQVAMPDPAD